MSSDAVRAFGREVRRQHIALNMSLETLAEQAGLTLSLDAAFRSAKGMGTDLPDLLGGYMRLSVERIEAGRLIKLMQTRAKRVILDLLRSFLAVKVERQA